MESWTGHQCDLTWRPKGIHDFRLREVVHESIAVPDEAHHPARVTPPQPDLADGRDPGGVDRDEHRLAHAMWRFPVRGRRFHPLHVHMWSWRRPSSSFYHRELRRQIDAIEAHAAAARDSRVCPAPSRFQRALSTARAAHA